MNKKVYPTWIYRFAVFLQIVFGVVGFIDILMLDPKGFIYFVPASVSFIWLKIRQEQGRIVFSNEKKN